MTAEPHEDEREERVWAEVDRLGIELPLAPSGPYAPGLAIARLGYCLAVAGVATAMRAAQGKDAS